MKNKDTNESGAVIVCSHIASKKHPILVAERSESTDPTDSGWQFLCNSGLDENIKTAQIWSVDEIIEIEPSLKGFLDLKIGTKLSRMGTNQPWIIFKAK